MIFFFNRVEKERQVVFRHKLMCEMKFLLFFVGLVQRLTSIAFSSIPCIYMLKYVYIYKQNGIYFMWYNRVKCDSTWKYKSRRKTFY